MDTLSAELKLKIYQRAYYLKKKKEKKSITGVVFTKGDYVITFS